MLGGLNAGLAQLGKRSGGHLNGAGVAPGQSWCVNYVQGSTLSTLLCSLFLGSLEREHLHPLLPGAAAQPTAPTCTLPPTPSSSARFTDLALAAGVVFDLSMTISSSSYNICSDEPFQSYRCTIPHVCPATGFHHSAH